MDEPCVPTSPARWLAVRWARTWTSITGIDMEALARIDAPRAERLVRSYLNPLADDEDEEADAEKASLSDEKASATKAEERRTKNRPANPRPAKTRIPPKPSHPPK